MEEAKESKREETVELPTKLSTSDKTEELPVKIGKEKYNSVEPTTVIQNFKKTVEKFGKKEALGVKRGDKWQKWTWQEYWDNAMAVARAFIHLGVQRFDAVAIIGFNSPEWFLADIGAIAAGAIACGIYPTNGPEASQYVADHADAAVVVAENEQQVQKFLGLRDKLPKVKAIIQWSGNVPESENGKGYVYTWDEFVKMGDAKYDEELQKRIADQKPGHCCTYVYTSGTTGPPKAVMLSHDNITWTSYITSSMFNLTSNDVLISYLPLSHVAAQMIDIHGPVTSGCSIFFARPDALKGSLVETLKEIRPTKFLGVPRVWEKIMEKMLEVGRKVHGIKKDIATWAKNKGKTGTSRERSGSTSKPFGWVIANALVFKKIKENLGLDRCQHFISGAAPIPQEVVEYFSSLYIPIYEIYGMSESSGPQTISLPGRYKSGTAGQVMWGAEIKIDNPDKDGNGEILFRGRHVFMGYMKNPTATKETIDNEGYLHSGDVGKVDSDGFLAITGRIKELIVTAGGENVPPVLIEDEIKKEIGDVISNVMVIGDKRKFLSCVITLKTEAKKDSQPGEYPFTDDLTDGCKQALKHRAGAECKTVQEAKADEKVLKFIQSGIDNANKRATSSAQRVQKFSIINQDFTIEGGELTPSMKLKRKVAAEKYNEDIENLYLTGE